jgi:hypothetical protein
VGASSTPNAYAPPRADPRATRYGFGVPLRPRNTPSVATAGIVALRPYARASAVPVTRDPTAPPWVSLPETSTVKSSPGTAVKPSRSTGAGAVKGSKGGCGCGCGPRGGHR